MSYAIVGFASVGQAGPGPGVFPKRHRSVLCDHPRPAELRIGTGPGHKWWP
jgi:hypothetical protein